ncbi:hypothetical protein EJ110_NYTH54487 [Nymphaea thermarum]|nr:hypothetical protein EJ110_NYTH54487 [Nymphaea thermarum]
MEADAAGEWEQKTSFLKADAAGEWERKTSFLEADATGERESGRPLSWKPMPREKEIAAVREREREREPALVVVVAGACGFKQRQSRWMQRTFRASGNRFLGFANPTNLISNRSQPAKAIEHRLIGSPKPSQMNLFAAYAPPWQPLEGLVLRYCLFLPSLLHTQTADRDLAILDLISCNHNAAMPLSPDCDCPDGHQSIRGGKEIKSVSDCGCGGAVEEIYCGSDQSMTIYEAVWSLSIGF